MIDLPERSLNPVMLSEAKHLSSGKDGEVQHRPH
jgi:hypothetical protein